MSVLFIVDAKSKGSWKRWVSWILQEDFQWIFGSTCIHSLHHRGTAYLSIGYLDALLVGDELYFGLCAGWGGVQECSLCSWNGASKQWGCDESKNKEHTVVCQACIYLRWFWWRAGRFFQIARDSLSKLYFWVIEVYLWECLFFLVRHYLKENSYL